MKLLISGILLFLVSCGGGIKYVPQNLTPVTFKVDPDYYLGRKDAFDSAEALIRSKTGKQLVKFVPASDRPNYSTVDEAYNSLGYDEHRVLFMSTYRNNLSDFPDNTAGIAVLTDKGEITKSLIVFSIFSPSVSDTKKFAQELYHETLHTLGFDHTFGTDYSIMNYSYTLAVKGLTDLDNARLAEKYPFSMENLLGKDLEKLAFEKESEKIEEISGRLSETFGLSVERSQEVAKTMVSLQKIQNKRALTEIELDQVSNKLLGFSYGTGRKAFEKYIQGDSTEIDKLLIDAANKNGVTPEDMKDLFGQYFGSINGGNI